MSNDPHALRPGASIAGYNIIRVLGVGGFGITYEADSPFTGKRVAIKEFFPRGIASREGNTRIIYAERDMEVVQWALKRFESSTLDQCRLKHPNIVDVIHYVKDNGTGYMIMEYVEGETLEHWLREGNRPPAPEELRLLMEPVLSALEYLHSRKMIHRDIAPDNIMVRADGRPMIIDFGAIKLIEQETQIRSNAEKSFMVAKQFYSPPEQIQDDGELDHRADIYATGAVLYRAFAGRPPVSAEERMQKLAFGKPDPLTLAAAAAPRLPRDLAAAIDRALSFNADNRQATIAELREALGWDDGAGLAATVALSRDADGARDDPVPKRSKLPWLLPLAGIATVLVAIVFAADLVSLSRSFAPKLAAPAPAPKFDEVKVVPQMPVHTTPAETPETKQATDATQLPDPPMAPLDGRYAGEITITRAESFVPGRILTTCQIDSRFAVAFLVQGDTVHITNANETFAVKIGEDNIVRVSRNFKVQRQDGPPIDTVRSFSAAASGDRIVGDFSSTGAFGVCRGKIVAVRVETPPAVPPSPEAKSETPPVICNKKTGTCAQFVNEPIPGKQCFRNPAGTTYAWRCKTN